MRAAIGLPVTSRPPMPAFSATNWAAVSCPARNADRPYWTPVLSSVLRTKPVLGLRPNWLTSCSLALHFTPLGLVTGFQRADTGIAALQLSVAVERLANVWSHETQLV